MSQRRRFGERGGSDGSDWFSNKKIEFIEQKRRKNETKKSRSGSNVSFLRSFVLESENTKDILLATDWHRLTLLIICKTLREGMIAQRVTTLLSP